MLPVPVLQQYRCHPCLNPALSRSVGKATILRREAKSGAPPSRVWRVLRPSTTTQFCAGWVVSTVSCSDTSSILTGRSRAGADRPSISTSHHTKGHVKRRFFFSHSRPLVGMVRGLSGLGEGRAVSTSSSRNPWIPTIVAPRLRHLPRSSFHSAWLCALRHDAYHSRAC